ncbi:MAG: hypothetical protein M1348_02420 [Candidatus Parvarchaeota archaeon]|jgi:hypothetical protein|nr:hypothetical protein [Candidatus Parvarchaeota archaeon]
MEMNVFDAVNEIKKFYDGTGSLSNLRGIIPAKKLDISLEHLDGAVKIKVSHPLRLKIEEIYKILLRLFMVSSTDLTVEFIMNGKHKSVSKKFGADESIAETINDLLDLPHEQLLDIIVETEYFKLVSVKDLSDTISIIMKKGDQKTLFRSLMNYLFPFISVSADKSAKEEIIFDQQRDELVVDVALNVDGASLGVKSKKVRLLDRV